MKKEIAICIYWVGLPMLSAVTLQSPSSHPVPPLSPPTQAATLYMAAPACTVEMFFFPFVGGGHLIPMIDLARLFASYGVKSTIITFPNDVAVFQKSITRDNQSGHDIKLVTLQLPPGASPLVSVDMSAPPITDTSILGEPLRKLLEDTRPDCIVVDIFHRWAADVIDEIGLARFIFNGSSCFSNCCKDSIEKHSPHKKVGSDSDPFTLPGLPDKVELTGLKLPEFFRTGKGFFTNSATVDKKSYGQIVNSFYELEPAYVDHLRNVLGKKAWVVGPVSLCNKNLEDKIDRGQESTIDKHSCLNWLDSKSPNSVVYVSFGSLARLSKAQLHEIALGLESSGHYFIWVVGKILDEKDGDSILPDGFEERVEKEKKGMIIKGWAPQLLILEHDAIGGFLTHCGWNSTLEALCAGVPLITWPLTAEQFHNENLLTEILKIGIRVGSEEWGSWNSERKVVIGRKKVEDAVTRLMSGEGDEVKGMRQRVKDLAEKARKAAEYGGSSFSDVHALIDELKSSKATAA